MKWTSSPFLLLPLSLQKQSFTDVLRNRCSQPVLESLFNKVPDLKAFKFIKKRLQHKCFPVNIAKFWRTTFLKNSSSGHFCLYKKMARWKNFETCFDTNYELEELEDNIINWIQNNPLSPLPLKCMYLLQGLNKQMRKIP